MYQIPQQLYLYSKLMPSLQQWNLGTGGEGGRGRNELWLFCKPNYFICFKAKTAHSQIGWRESFSLPYEENFNLNIKIYRNLLTYLKINYFVSPYSLSKMQLHLIPYKTHQIWPIWNFLPTENHLQPEKSLNSSVWITRPTLFHLPYLVL